MGRDKRLIVHLGGRVKGTSLRWCHVVRKGGFGGRRFVENKIQAPAWLPKIEVRAELNKQNKLVVYGLGSLPEKFENVLAEFGKNPRTVYDWFYKNPTDEEVMEMYKKLQTAWHQHREFFPNKGSYKTVQRLFVKNMARFWSKSDLYFPMEVHIDVLYKRRQGWLSFAEAEQWSKQHL